MQFEVLRFLIEAKSQFRSADDGDVRQEETFEDLQAVDRTLPDCDWFELEEIREPRGEAGLLWDSAVPVFEL